MIKISIIIFLNIIFSQYALELIGEEFDKPIFATHNPSKDKDIYVVEQSGMIWIIDDYKNEKIFLDIENRVHQPLFPADERGLLGFTFDNKGEYIYVNYIDRKDSTKISQFKIENNKPVHDSEKIIMSFKQPYNNHNGGALAFGQDNNLYISVGDGGSAGDPENRAQDLTNVFGTILRIKIDKNGSYTIPDDNPFFNSLEFREEIWSYGLRNVWKFSFDRVNGNMYLGDVGQNLWEEINFEHYESKGGLNFGWNFKEGNHQFLENSNHEINLVDPIFEYPNDANYIKTIFGIKQKNVHGCSVTGGYVYRGKKHPELYGHYFFGDYCTGRIWSILFDGEKIIEFHDLTDVLLKKLGIKSFYLSSFGETYDGELLLVDYSGKIYLLTSEN